MIYQLKYPNLIIRPIKKGEELFTDYNYDMSYDSAPRWYKKLYHEWYRTGTGDGEGSD